MQPTTGGNFWRYVNSIASPWSNVINWTGLTANGLDNKTTTTELKFNENPGSAFTINNIMITGATKGELSGTGTTRTLTISNITVANGETVSVSLINPSNIMFTDFQKTVTVYVAPISVKWLELTAN